MKYSLLLTAIAVATTGYSQQILKTGGTPSAGSISSPMAAAVAERFARKLGFRTDYARGTASYDPGVLPYRPARWVMSSAGIRVEVDSRADKVLSLWNDARIDDQNHGRHRTGKPLFTNRARAKAYIEKLVARIGTPQGCVMRFAYYLEGTVKDQNSSGSFGAVYIRNSRPVMTISCDIQDGVPVSITLR